MPNNSARSQNIRERLRKKVEERKSPAKKQVNNAGELIYNNTKTAEAKVSDNVDYREIDYLENMLIDSLYSLKTAIDLFPAKYIDRADSNFQKQFEVIMSMKDESEQQHIKLDENIEDNALISTYRDQVISSFKDVLHENLLQEFSKTYHNLYLVLFSYHPNIKNSYAQAFYSYIKLGEIFLQAYNEQVKDITSQTKLANTLLTQAFKYFGHAERLLIADVDVINSLRIVLPDGRYIITSKSLELLKHFRDETFSKIIESISKMIEGETLINLQDLKSFYKIALQSHNLKLCLLNLYLNHSLLGEQDNMGQYNSTKESLINLSKVFNKAILKEKARLNEIAKHEESIAKKTAEKLIKQEQAKHEQEEAKKHKLKERAKDIPQTLTETEKKDNVEEGNLLTEPKNNEITMGDQVLSEAISLLSKQAFTEAKAKIQAARKFHAEQANVRDEMKAITGLADCGNFKAEKLLAKAMGMGCSTSQKKLLSKAQTLVLEAIGNYQLIINKYLLNDQAYTALSKAKTYNIDDVKSFVLSDIEKCQNNLLKVTTLIHQNLENLREEKAKNIEHRESEYIRLGLRVIEEDLAHNHGVITNSWDSDGVMYISYPSLCATPMYHVREAGKYLWEHKYDHLSKEEREEKFKQSEAYRINQNLEEYNDLNKINMTIRKKVEETKRKLNQVDELFIEATKDLLDVFSYAKKTGSAVELIPSSATEIKIGPITQKEITSVLSIREIP
jgi:hypothetical protein